MEMSKPAPVLLRIAARKLEEARYLTTSGLAERYKQKAYEAALESRGFYLSLSKSSNTPLLIAEIKPASPSKGLIRPGSKPSEIAKVYEACGVAAISVLTDKDFGANPEYLLEACQNTQYTPNMMKDFVLHKEKLYEAKAHGADASLLIASLLTTDQLTEYIGVARELGMDCLVEVHDEEDIEKARQAGAVIYGINNRDLNRINEKDNTDLDTTQRLIRTGLIPADGLIVSESGIFTYGDVKQLLYGPDGEKYERVPNAILVGEAIMSAERNPTYEVMRNTIFELQGKRSV